ADPADLPVAGEVDDVVAGQGDRADEGGPRGSRRRTDEGEFQRWRPTVAEGPDEVDEDGGDRRAAERQPDVVGRRGHAEVGDAEDDGEGGTGVDAEDAGVGQRIAGDTLHHRTGDAEGGAGDDGEDGPR